MIDSQYKDLKNYLVDITEGNLRELIGQDICDVVEGVKIKNKNKFLSK